VVSDRPANDDVRRHPGSAPFGDARRPPFEPERFERVDEEPATEPVSARRSRSGPTPAELPADLVAELASAAGSDWSHLRRRVTERMLAGLGAYQRERYRDASRMLKTVVDAVPAAPSPLELLGLSQYHLGQWRAARASLEVAAELSGSVDQFPVLMDCDRALGRRRRVRERFDALRQASPDADVLTEARLVLAGAMTDAGDLAGAIELLVSAGAGRHVRNPAPRHLRQWYVLADLAERSGELARARELFGRVAAADPGAYDVDERLAQLGASTAARAGRNGSRDSSSDSSRGKRAGRPGR
jgi:tetratricopeptide (TPR) repeat protein